MEKTGRGKTLVYIGSCAAIGAAVGLLFGMLLFNSVPWGILAGVVVGLLAGVFMDARSQRPN
jgi:F0F1-type ATP synthase assembly protein I